MSRSLSDLDRRTRDIEQAVMMAGMLGPELERRLIGVREAVEDADRLVRN